MYAPPGDHATFSTSSKNAPPNTRPFTMIRCWDAPDAIIVQGAHPISHGVSAVARSSEPVVANEGDPRSVGRPARVLVPSAVGRELADVRAVWVHGEDLVVTIPPRHERDPR